MSLMEPLDLSGPLRTAILNNTAITPYLALWNGEPGIFTRRPVPEGFAYPGIVVSPNVAITDADYLVERRPILERDLIVYGQQGVAGALNDQYRTVEGVAYLLRQQFHRQKFSLNISPYYSVSIITASGPHPAPTDDERLVARAVLLRIQLETLPG